MAVTTRALSGVLKVQYVNGRKKKRNLAGEYMRNRRRWGNPRTDEDRKKRHKQIYGTLKNFPRRRRRKFWT